MKASQISAGGIETVEVVSIDSRGFDPAPEKGEEISFFRTDPWDPVLLKYGTAVYTVEGADRNHQRTLGEVIEKKFPRICWTVKAIREEQHVSRLILQIHQFPYGLTWDNTDLDIGFNDQFIEKLEIFNEDIKYRLEKESASGKKEFIEDWLTKKFLIDSVKEEPLKRVLLTAGPRIEETPDHFRLIGHRFALDVFQTSEQVMLIDKIVNYRHAKGLDESRPIYLVNGNFGFCDVSNAKKVRGMAEVELERIVKDADSYIRLWTEYNNIEAQNRLTEARSLGWLRYDKLKSLQNGNWSVNVVKKGGNEKSMERFEELSNRPKKPLCEASVEIPEILLNPKLDQDSEISISPLIFEEQRRNPFFGFMEKINLQKGIIELSPKEKDDDEDSFNPPPRKGYLFLSLIGHKKSLQRRYRAAQFIGSSRSHMPRLAFIIENKFVPPISRKQIQPISKSVRELFSEGRPTQTQEEAIRIALNTPDIALIQGPPGTGKTKVITALERRIAEEESDSAYVSGRILVTGFQQDTVDNLVNRSLVFGLPAYRVGGPLRNLRNLYQDNVENWRTERVEMLDDDLKASDNHPLTHRLGEIQNLLDGYYESPGNRDNAIHTTRKILDLAGKDIPVKHLKELHEFTRKITPPAFSSWTVEKKDLAERSVRSLRTTPETFSDDGPQNAYKVIRYMEETGVGLKQEDKDLLSHASSWDSPDPPDSEMLSGLADLQRRLLDELVTEVPSPFTNECFPELEEMFARVIQILEQEIRNSREGKETVLWEYYQDLCNDPENVRMFVQKYTAIHAATCQQSKRTTKIKLGNLVQRDDYPKYNTVIVDEAARANPLDLFIPMAMASRRIILVGDHRQLPHVLDQKVERAMKNINEATREAIQESLFERLFILLREREKKDGICRTITLDEQFRMHPILADFVSKTFYESRGDRKIKSSLPSDRFIHNFSGYEESVAAWIDVPASKGTETMGKSKSRPVEAEILAKELKKLMDARPDLTFGVITFYAHQREVLKRELAKKRIGIFSKDDDGELQIVQAYRFTKGSSGEDRLRIGTVDAFQGMEFDVVFLSLTRCNTISVPSEENEKYHRMVRNKYGFLTIENRLCVAMSRQKRLLIVVGDAEMAQGQAAEKEVPGLFEFWKFTGGIHGKRIQS